MPARLVDRCQRPWNKGLLVGQKKPLEPKHVWSIRVRPEIARSVRDLAIFNLAIDSKLRACDLVKLRLDDICSGTNVRRRATIVQKKTGRPVQFEISEQSRNSVEAWLPTLRGTGSRYLFPTRIHASPHISIRQYARLVHRWIKSIGLESASYGTHSMRRTKAAQIYRKTGNLRAVQLLLGHAKLESTVRYLGIEVGALIFDHRHPRRWSIRAMSGRSDRVHSHRNLAPIAVVKVFSADDPPWRRRCPHWIDSDPNKTIEEQPPCGDSPKLDRTTDLRLQRKTKPRDVMIKCPSAAPLCAPEHPTIPSPGHRARIR